MLDEKHDFFIRCAQERDVEGIVSIEMASFSCPWSERMIREAILFGGRTRILVAVAESDNRILGYISYCAVMDEIQIMNIATHPEHLRQGIAHALLCECLENAREMDAIVIHLEVRESNAAAIALYERMDFRRVGKRPRYYVKPVEDALLLSLELAG